MGKQEDNLIRAAEIVANAKNQKTTEQLIDEKLAEIRKLDILAEVSKLDHFDEITKQLSDDERKQFDDEAEDVAETYSDLLSAVADILKDPETRAGIIEELKRRAG
jgi:hypothetical protein